MAALLRQQQPIVALKSTPLGTSLEEVAEHFVQVDKDMLKSSSYDFYEAQETNHGRKEVRRYITTDNIEDLAHGDDWKGFDIIGAVRSERKVKGKVSIEYRYYIGSIENDAKRFAQTVRGHWGIENSLHWVLDIAFREDESRVRKGHAPENLSLLRHIAVNLLRQEKSAKLGVKNKRLKAGWDEDYMLKVLSGNSF